ncbi:MAG: hypothetical protein JNM18_05040 [Planctomycetaceae bacterium]|nr:hypothetical protein [Planctomycetaceae bacterium]
MAAVSGLTYLGNLNFAGNDVLTVTSNDLGNTGVGSALTDTDSMLITVSAVNDGPTNTVPAGVQHVNEDTPLTITGVSISDVDAGANPISVTLSVVSGTVTVATNIGGGVTSGSISGNGSGSVTITASQAAINATFAGASGLVYQGNSDFFGSDTLTITTNDLGYTGTPGAMTDTDTIQIAVAAVNDAPSGTTSGGNSSYTENQSPVFVDTGIVVTDDTLQWDTETSSYVAQMSGATVQITGNYVPGEDVLSYNGAFGISTSFNSVTGTLTLSGVALTANYQQALRWVTYHNTSENPSTLTRVATFTAYDGTTTTVLGPKNITVTAVNDSPVNALPGGKTLNEDATLAITGISISDVDVLGNPATPSNTVTVTLGVVNGVLNLSTSVVGGVNAGQVTNNGTGTVTITAPLAAINTTLANASGLIYAGNAQYFGPDTLSITTNDLGNTGTGGALVDSDTLAITVSAVNDAPVITATGAALAYAENDPATAVDPALALFDVEANVFPGSETYSSATVSITSGFVSGQDVLALTPMLGITGTFNPSTGILTLAGTSSAANYLTALQSVTYIKTSDNPTVGARVVSFQINDDGVMSNVTTRTVNVSATNDAPVVTTAGTTLTYTENNPGTAVDPTLLINDVDNANLVSAVVQITTGFNAAQDSLLFTNQLGITGNYNAANGTLTLTGTTTVANYRTALRTVAYANSSDAPNSTSRLVEFTVNDGGLNSAVASRAINIAIVNDVSVVDLNGVPSGLNYTAAFTEGSGPTAIVNSTGLTVVDVDNTNLASATVTLTNIMNANQETLAVNTSGTAISAVYNATSGVLSLTGTDTVANYQQVLRTLTYDNSSTTPNAAQRQVTVSVNDGLANSVNVTSYINVTAVANTPVVSIAGGAVSYTENAAATVIDSALNISDADSTNLQSATISITGGFTPGDTLSVPTNNGLTISYNSSSGVMSITGISSLATYQNVLRTVGFSSSSENPTNAARTVQFVVNDGTAGPSVAVTRTVNVTPVNDVAVVDLNGGGAGVNYSTSYTAMSSIIPIVGSSSLTLTDVDNTQMTGATISLSSVPNSPSEVLAANVSGTAITAGYNASTGVLTLSGTDTTANYQQVLRTLTYTNSAAVPNTSTRTITTLVNDGTANSAAVTTTITYSLAGGGGAAPVLDLNGAATATPYIVTFTEDAGSIAIIGTAGSTAATLTDSDSPTMASATISLLSPPDGANELLSANTTGFPGITASYNTTTFVLTLTGIDTVANYQSVLRTVRYENTSNTPTIVPQRTINWVINDGANNSSTMVTKVTVVAANDAPTVVTTGSTLSYTEDATANIAVTPIDPGLTISDPDSTQLSQATIAITGNYMPGEDVLTFTNSGGMSAAHFNFNTTTGIATLTATTSIANFQTALRNVNYKNTSHNPTLSTRTISFTAKDTSAAVSLAATRQISITATNDLAVLDLNGTAAAGLNSTVAHASSGSPVNVTALTASLTDRDDITASKSLTVTLTGNTNGANESLSANVTGTGLAANYNSLTGVLTINGVGTVAEYQQVLRTVQYNNVALPRTAGNRTASIVFNDSIGNSNTATSTITVGSPMLAKGGAISGGITSTLTSAQLQPIVNAAVDRWTATGLTGEQISTLKSTQFVVTNLDGANALGLTTPGLVQVDDNGAGRGWFIDQTPGDNSEFRQFVSLTELNATEGAAADHYDLLTLVMHELGHVLGLDDFDADLRDGDVMTGEMGVGTRRMPIFGEADPVFRDALNAVFGDLATSTTSADAVAKLSTTTVAGLPLDQVLAQGFFINTQSSSAGTAATDKSKSAALAQFFAQFDADGDGDA